MKLEGDEQRASAPTALTGKNFDRDCLSTYYIFERTEVSKTPYSSGYEVRLELVMLSDGVSPRRFKSCRCRLKGSFFYSA